MNDNNVRKTVLGGLFWKFGERMLSQGITFVVSLILARLLSPDDYGIIAIAMTFMNLAAVFINSGFATALIQKKDADDTDFSTMFFCSLACSAVIYGVIFLTSPLIARFYEVAELTLLLRVFALQIPVSVYNSIQLAYVSRHMQFRKVFISSVINAVVSGAMGIGMAFGGFGVWALVAQSLAATLTNSLVLTVLVPWRPRWKFSKQSAKSMMKYGSGLLAADLSGTFFYELRGIIIGKVYTTADLAYYNKGIQIPQLITNNLSAILVSVLFPTLANHNDDLAQVKSMAKRSLRVLAYIMVPCMFGLSAVMEPLILLLFTDKWAQTIPFGQVLSIGCCISLISDISLQILKAIGRSDVVLGLEVRKKPVYVLLLLLGVKVNVFVLAVAMLVYDIYAMFINMLQLKKYIFYGIWEQILDLLPAFALGAVMAVAVWLVPGIGGLIPTLAIKVALGAAIYVGGSVVLRMEEFRYLLNIVLERMGKKKA